VVSINDDERIAILCITNPELYEEDVVLAVASAKTCGDIAK
jgi:hypothetical protein